MKALSFPAFLSRPRQLAICWEDLYALEINWYPNCLYASYLYKDTL